MGYTHYWRGTPKINAADVRKIVKAAGVPVAGWDGSGKPTISDDIVRLNGSGDDAYETFVLDTASTGFGFCKTAREPYDLTVTTILLRVSATSEGFDVSSDGEWEDEDEWVPARNLYKSIFGEEAPKPENVN